MIPKILTYEQIIREETLHIIPFILLSDSIYRDIEKDSDEIICTIRSDDLFRYGIFNNSSIKEKNSNIKGKFFFMK